MRTTHRTSSDTSRRALSWRRATVADAAALRALYAVAAGRPNELVFGADELDAHATLAAGLAITVDVDRALLAVAHAARFPGTAFAHRLGPLTLVVHPDHQRRGIGRWLLGAYLAEVTARMPHVCRVELITRASNGALLHMLGELGFMREGLHRSWLRRADTLEDAIPMVWFNPSYRRAIARGSASRIP
jgi:putative acetyltransferase